MPDVFTFTPQKPRDGSSQRIYSAVAMQKNASVMQDNAAQQACRRAFSQPVPLQTRMGAAPEETIVVRSQIHSKNGEKLERAVTYLPRDVKAELARITKQWQEKDKDISLSAVISAFVQRQVQGHIDMQYGALLEPIIKEIIRDEMRTFKTHLAWLLVRVAYDTGQTRSLVTNILNRQPGMTDDIFKTIVKESARSAKGNITRRTPQMTELIEAVEQWMGERGAEETNHKWQSYD